MTQMKISKWRMTQMEMFVSDHCLIEIYRRLLSRRRLVRLEKGRAIVTIITIKTRPYFYLLLDACWPISVNPFGLSFESISNF